MQPMQTSIAAPAEIQQVADRYKMGVIKQVFGPNLELARVRRRGGYMLLGFGLILCLCGLASMAGGAAGWVFILIALFPAGIGIGFFSWASGLENKAIKLYLCEKGFVYKHGTNAAQPFRWDQITNVWRNVIRVYRNNTLLRIMHAYTIERKDGYKITLNDDFNGVETVGNIISEQTTTILLPLATESYARGDTIHFGPVSLSQQGLTKGNDLLSWQQIEVIDTKDGFVRVKRNGKWSNWEDSSKIPNLLVFLNLTDFALKQGNNVRGSAL